MCAGRLEVDRRLNLLRQVVQKEDPKEEKNNLPERMTTLTSFSSLEISELEVKGLILSLFQVILVADGSNYLSHFFGTARAPKGRTTRLLVSSLVLFSNLKFLNL